MSETTSAACRFDVALSFAGAQRDFAKRLRNELRRLQLKVFFDEDFEHEMLGTDGQDYLRRVYGRESRLCVVLVSPDYDKRAWTRLERETIQGRELRGDTGALIPVLVDAYHPEWLPVGRIYYDASRRSLAQLARVLERRLRQHDNFRAPAPATNPGHLVTAAGGDRYSTVCRLAFIHGFHEQGALAASILPVRQSPHDPITVYLTEDDNGVLYAHSNHLVDGTAQSIKIATNETRDLRSIARTMLQAEVVRHGSRAITFLCDQRLVGADGSLRLDGWSEYVVRVVSAEPPSTHSSA